eukprot:NODE_16015_length_1017_cov_3.046067.p1 GENE.NODE_16015_length_1017_cov_3.046067~~NODE_16015_length_1017_cov_3.046067.p1  ORF type:complete len:324 (+),score=38.96 NODE_16015_length_1017_cov_3.046067:115-972(+)
MARASDAIVEVLLKAHPDAVSEEDRFGQLPLHWALRARASNAVIVMLCKAHPDAVKEKDGDNVMLPLHWALDGRASDTVIEMLFKAHPDAVKEKDCCNGMLPLHWALRAQFSDAVVEMLLKAHPDAVREEDRSGKLPLHLALGAHASHAVIEMLLKAHPDAANLSTREIASLVYSVASNDFFSLDKIPRLFPIVSGGTTTLGAFESVTSALMARCQGEVLGKSLGLLRVWHHGGMLWKMCIVRTVGQVLPQDAAHIISKFVCGKCACELCCRPRPEAEAAPGGDE